MSLLPFYLGYETGGEMILLWSSEGPIDGSRRSLKICQLLTPQKKRKPQSDLGRVWRVLAHILALDVLLQTKQPTRRSSRRRRRRKRRSDTLPILSPQTPSAALACFAVFLVFIVLFVFVLSGGKRKGGSLGVNQSRNMVFPMDLHYVNQVGNNREEEQPWC